MSKIALTQQVKERLPLENIAVEVDTHLKDITTNPHQVSLSALSSHDLNGGLISGAADAVELTDYVPLGQLLSHIAASAGTSGIQIAPEYDGGVFCSRGATNVLGVMNTDRDFTQNRNVYDWFSAEPSFQQYCIAVQVKLPRNITSFTGSFVWCQVPTDTQLDMEFLLEGTTILSKQITNVPSFAPVSLEASDLATLNAQTWLVTSNICVLFTVYSQNSAHLLLSDFSLSWA